MEKSFNKHTNIHGALKKDNLANYLVDHYSFPKKLEVSDGLKLAKNLKKSSAPI